MGQVHSAPSADCSRLILAAVPLTAGVLLILSATDGIIWLFAVLPLLIIVAINSATDRRLLEPGPFFSAYWAVATIAPLVALPGARVSRSAILFIFTVVFLFSMGYWLATIGSNNFQTQSNCLQSGRVHVLACPAVLRLLAMVGTLSGLLAAVLVISRYGFNVVGLLSIDGLLGTANTVSVARYANLGQSSNPIVPGLLGVAYAASLTSPFHILGTSAARRGHILASGPFLSLVAYSIVTTERFAMLVSASLMVGGLIAAHALKNGEVHRISVRTAVIASIAASVVGILFMTIAFVRTGRIDHELIPIMQDKFALYAFGYLPGFSEWLVTHPAESPLLWGTASVAGVGALLGKDRTATRSFDESVVIDDRGLTTNIYTAFRGLILDYGVVGTLLCLFVVGFVLGRVYRHLQRSPSFVGAGALACSYAIILLSQTQSIISFTNVFAGMVIGIVALWFSAWPGICRLGTLSQSAVR